MNDRSVNNIYMSKIEFRKATAKDNKSKVIITASMKLFAENGFQATSISMISKEIGISKSLLYNYFASKEDLVKAVIEFGLDEMFGQLEIPNHDFDDAAMCHILDRNFEMMDMNPEYWKVYFSMMMQPRILKLTIQILMDKIQPIMGHFVQFFKDKGFEEFEKEALFAGSIIDGVSLNYLYNKDYYPKEYAIKRIKEILKIKI